MNRNYGSFDDNDAYTTVISCDPNVKNYKVSLKKCLSADSLKNLTDEVIQSKDQGHSKAKTKSWLPVRQTSSPFNERVNVRSLEQDLDFINKSYGHVQKLSSSLGSLNQFDVKVDVHPFPNNCDTNYVSQIDKSVCPSDLEYQELSISKACDDTAENQWKLTASCGSVNECNESVIDSNQNENLSNKYYNLFPTGRQNTDCVVTGLHAKSNGDIFSNSARDNEQLNNPNDVKKPHTVNSNRNRIIATQNNKLVSLSLSLLVAALLQVVRCLTVMLDDTLSCFRQDLF